MSLKEAKRLSKQGQQKLAEGDFEGAIAKFKQSLRFQNNHCWTWKPGSFGGSAIWIAIASGNGITIA
ncbi:MAG: hypothetical protein VKJ64_02935 [Leptolyngbyaceae bacterium]|nr:hypothetical protein [Leptolyngbyaceae bacterium]